eukprot:3939297-Rhodomonas_salina.3
MVSKSDLKEAAEGAEESKHIKVGRSRSRSRRGEEEQGAPCSGTRVVFACCGVLRVGFDRWV